MWVLLAVASAFFAGVTSILAKCGIKHTDSMLATAIRTVVILFFSIIMIFAAGERTGGVSAVAGQLRGIEGRTLLFLTLSGLATGASWLCYFRALQTGDINKVVPIDKSSTVLTILLAFLFLGEPVSAEKQLGVLLIGVGTYLMLDRKGAPASSWRTQRGAVFFAACSAVFAALTAILGKIGISGVDSNLGTAIRTFVVLVTAWMIVFVSGRAKEIVRIPRRELLFICLSGLATGASWLCYYRALQDGPASVVVPIDKLSILVTTAFSGVVFGERLSAAAALGLAGIVLGTLVMI